MMYLISPEAPSCLPASTRKTLAGSQFQLVNKAASGLAGNPGGTSPSPLAEKIIRSFNIYLSSDKSASRHCHDDHNQCSRLSPSGTAPARIISTGDEFAGQQTKSEMRRRSFR
ncbi:hypothetical protein [Saccharopolyspora sp. ASAGF58]|uniref:hypothetical protein n=1 Tax=Saccharopolyspora sp. ASAGF58 TaxID=2719023 RepID=UPI001444F621|nr:hypothetical protein [Saccharopolyspora sp. ASAGF58]